MRLIPLSACRRMPWKNGGGVTTEIAIGPEGASLEDFGWRISMAEVAQDGPFSSFPGVDRTLAVLSGNGIRLEFGDGEVVELDQTSQPYPFAADRDVHAVLCNGLIKDLNVMSRRDAWSHTIRRLEGPASHRFACKSGLFVLVAGAGEWRAGARPAALALAPGDSVVLTPPDAITLVTQHPGCLFAIHVSSC